MLWIPCKLSLFFKLILHDHHCALKLWGKASSRWTSCKWAFSYNWLAYTWNGGMIMAVGQHWKGYSFFFFVGSQHSYAIVEVHAVIVPRILRVLQVLTYVICVSLLALDVVPAHNTYLVMHFILTMIPWNPRNSALAILTNEWYTHGNMDIVINRLFLFKFGSRSHHIPTISHLPLKLVMSLWKWSHCLLEHRIHLKMWGLNAVQSCEEMFGPAEWLREVETESRYLAHVRMFQALKIGTTHVNAI